jgi:hypothetical protein
MAALPKPTTLLAAGDCFQSGAGAPARDSGYNFEEAPDTQLAASQALSRASRRSRGCFWAAHVCATMQWHNTPNTHLWGKALAGAGVGGCRLQQWWSVLSAAVSLRWFPNGVVCCIAYKG